ncbi:erythromycin esterase family protein [Bacillus sp. NP157]|nr:erythromycin esterase family protein [Bacillus sp. NP157]
MPSPVTEKALAATVAALCPRPLVILGEDANHAGAQTLAVKIGLVHALVARCGFRGIVFESQFYDMLDLQRSLDTGAASEAQLASAIGALWSRYAIFQPFEQWLFDEAQAKRLRVGGMDPQVGGVGARYSPAQLPVALASVLPRDERDLCQAAMARHNAWTYDDAHPFDDAAFRTLEQCATHVVDAIARHPAAASPRLAAMAASYRLYLDSANPSGGDPAARDKGMYRNLTWLLAQWPKGTKVIVWTASVHASKAPIPGSRSAAPTFGTYVHDAMGSGSYVLGFSALAGSYGSAGGRGKDHELGAPPVDAIERVATHGGGSDAEPGGADFRFLPWAVLERQGMRPGRAFNYASFQELDWKNYIDGLVILDRETAAEAGP